MRVYLETGSIALAIDAREPGSTGFGGGVADVLLDKHNHRALWEAHGPEILGNWITAHPGRRPVAWWKYTAPESRRQLRGAGRPVIGPYGRDSVESWREHAGLPVLLGLEPDDPPTFESEPATLRRLGLLDRDEVRRLTPADYAPVEMRADAGTSLGYRPRGDGLDDDDLEDALADEDTESDDGMSGEPDASPGHTHEED
jgi:hypothetical protein